MHNSELQKGMVIHDYAFCICTHMKYTFIQSEKDSSAWKQNYIVKIRQSFFPERIDAMQEATGNPANTNHGLAGIG